LRLRTSVLALHVRRRSSVVPEQGGDSVHAGGVLAVRLCVHWLAVRNAVCGCKRNGLSLGHRLAVAASLRRPVRSAVQTGQFRTATCQNGWLNRGRHPPAGRPAAAARRLRRGVAWHARWPVLRWNRCVVLHMHVARAHGSRRRRRRPALATTNGARGWQLFVGAVVASPVAAATATAN